MTIEQERNTLVAVIGKPKAQQVFKNERCVTIEQELFSLAFPTDTKTLTMSDLGNLADAARTLPTFQMMLNHNGREEVAKRLGRSLALPAAAPVKATAQNARTAQCGKCGAPLSSTGCKVCGGVTAKAPSAPTKPLFGLARAAAAIKKQMESKKR